MFKTWWTIGTPVIFEEFWSNDFITPVHLTFLHWNCSYTIIYYDLSSSDFIEGYSYSFFGYILNIEELKNVQLNGVICVSIILNEQLNILQTGCSREQVTAGKTILESMQVLATFIVCTCNLCFHNGKNYVSIIYILR